MSLAKYIRHIVLGISAVVALAIYEYVQTNIPSPELQKIRLVQLYAFASLIYLYLALLASPLYTVFPYLPWRGLYVKARRALGVSTFFFGLLHATIAFFGSLGGFQGLGFLSRNYLIAIGLGASALFILLCLAATSFDVMVNRLGSKWKVLHRFVYAAGILILIHALMLGTHFEDLSAKIPQIVFACILFLLTLEAIRIDKYLAQKYPLSPRFGLPLVVFVGLLVGVGYYLFSPTGATQSLGIHAQHIAIAKQAQQGTPVTNTTQPNIPGLDGDRTKRYTVSFNAPQNVRANQDVQLQFSVFEATNGIPVSIFKQVQEKLAHLIIVDSELGYFEHIHPEQQGSTFVITTKFPKDGRYHLYLDFQPLGGIEQQIALTLPVGNVSQSKPAVQPVDTSLTKIFGDYEVTLQTPGVLKAQQMSIGQQAITFSIKDAATKNPITNLKPYLAAFGHLVMINQETYDYLHVHPSRLTPPAPNELGGPTVEFLPVGLYGPIKPGNYRAFAQFNHNDKLFVADFTIKIE